ncbi:MAG: THUMP domain-containing protein [Candidatus Accumulibacter sp.]|jgi:putative N6-adenine-specific DNA methylase|nr:THUMP domain-containing protein [Accumulibacter sp.]
MENFFAPCPRGVETLLEGEFDALELKNLKRVPGGVHFDSDWLGCYSANLYSRIATRVLWRVAHGPYAVEDDIYRLAKDVPWHRFFSPAQTIRVGVTAVKSPLKSLEFITLRIKDAVCDRFRAETGQRPSVDTREADIRIHAFIDAERCTLYIDTSGAPLHQRGLRRKTVDAPLKENLAAAILRMTGWRPGTPLYDPMCGSGTFLLEAVQIAFGIAPGASGRSFGFQRLKNFQPEIWKVVLETAHARVRPIRFAQIYGSDSSPVALRATLANLDRAGLLPAVSLKPGDILDTDAPTETPGTLIANPPYGERLSELEELAAFYPRLASAFKRRFAGWDCWLLSSDTRMPKLMRLAPGRKIPLFNGGLECRLYEFRMVSGSNRTK